MSANVCDAAAIATSEVLVRGRRQVLRRSEGGRFTSTRICECCGVPKYFPLGFRKNKKARDGRLRICNACTRPWVEAWKDSRAAGAEVDA